jgi:hypothetical protein
MLKGLFVAFLLLASAANAQEVDSAAPGASDAHELAKQLNNPVSSLISVPFQENVDFSVGPDEGVKSTLNFQPVVPVSINRDWNVIIRTIVPVIYQHDVIPDSNEVGLSDITQSFFFSPSHPGRGGIIWAVGTVFLYPTATNRYIGGKKWGAGPTIVVLKQSGKNTAGVLANHIWSVAGNEDRSDVSSTFIQPFFSHTTLAATTWGINSESTYDWKSRRWTVPVNLTVTQLTKMGKQPVSVGGGFRYYAVAPRDGPNWGMRMIFTLLFPTKK